MKMDKSDVFLISDSSYELRDIKSKFSMAEPSWRTKKMANLESIITKLKSKMESFRGLLIGALAAFFFALFGILNKKATFVTATEQSAIRYFMQIILMIAIANYNKESILGPKEQRKLLLVRGLFGAISFISFGFSVKYIEPSDTQALYNARIVIIPILASIFLKEKLNLIHIVGFISTIIGVVLISEQSLLMSLIVSSNTSNCTIQTNPYQVSNSKFYIGIALGLISAFAASCVAILLKKLTNLKVHYSVNVIFSSYIGFPSALLISLIMYLTETRDADLNSISTNEKLAWQIVFSFTSAICGCLNQLLVAIANKYESANKLAIISTTNLFWSFLFDFVFLGNQQCLSFMNVFNISGTLLFSKIFFKNQYYNVHDSIYFI